MTERFQDLAKFRMPTGFRGRSALAVQLWWIVQASAFRWSPQFAYGFRRVLLRLFGARVGKGVIIRPSAEITYPWKVTIGDHAWIGDHAVLYSLGNIHIGSHSVISQRSYLCGGDHDYTQIDFPIRGRDIHIGSEVWIAADVFIAPGITVGDGTVIGSRSSVYSDQPDAMVCMGSPCRPIKPRPPSRPVPTADKQG